ncbi:hypothetical protein CIP107512_01923 [Corynebacterium diphtheriae]|uniref:hypothetical protein n=1 Tax=Corynebacterium diphtheriae TaxID=1717 RepID=UPI0013CD06ED|nr:hypothetical protein [Corynebacterium diphtheriae bv. mitis]CAB0567414.1 hypothetical protein CIP107512_01923 [Corynebacterium diphtheriae]CAB0620224.1 hypothetical protein CIP107557_02109 [Corynebacterium diphtheriae]CAB0693767.1 hypothetical protein FRC0032_01093 [Corynebacterium diphtheriae]CAB0706216.1 hypothetical protein FRC0082_01786 [Corynebacterium diphtheriae]
MQPNGNAIVDTICRAAEHGDVTVIEAKPINEYPTCGQPRVLRDHAIRPARLLAIAPGRNTDAFANMAE